MLNLIEQASRIYSFFKPLKAELALGLSSKFKNRIYCKFESRNITGSFKERGALNALLSLQKKKKEVITASAGNHALALSYYAKKLGIKCTVVCPESAPVTKISRIKSLGANVILHGENFDQAISFAKTIQSRSSAFFVHPYDQLEVIAGQGTIGLELHKEVPDVKSIIVPLGGGGLISGIATFIKSVNPKIKVIGVRSLWTKSKSQLKGNSLADGIAVKNIGALTKNYVKKYVDDIIYVSEEEIADSILTLLNYEKILVEGAGAVSLVPVIRGDLKSTDYPTCLLICGSNIDISVLSRLILRKLRQEGRLVKIRVGVPDKPGMLGLAASVIGAQRGQIIQTYHDRLDAPSPISVGITFLIEVFDFEHAQKIVKELSKNFEFAEILESSMFGD